MQKILSLLFLFLISIQALAAQQYKLTVCAIFQNEADYLAEWVNYHHKLGVEHFWLYNNKSTDQWEEVLKPYIDQGLVEIKYWPDLWPEFFGNKCQPLAYNDCLKLNGSKTKWMAIIDTDEFIVPMKHRHIVEVLDTVYANSPAVYVSWLLFGTGGVKINREESMLQGLTKCSHRGHPWNIFGKSIIRPNASQE